MKATLLVMIIVVFSMSCKPQQETNSMTLSKNDLEGKWRDSHNPDLIMIFRGDTVICYSNSGKTESKYYYKLLREFKFKGRKVKIEKKDPAIVYFSNDTIYDFDYITGFSTTQLDLLSGTNTRTTTYKKLK